MTNVNLNFEKLEFNRRNSLPNEFGSPLSANFMD